MPACYKAGDEFASTGRNGRTFRYASSILATRERHNAAYFDGHRESLTRHVKFRRAEEADHRESGFVAVARGVWRSREKTTLKFHVTTKWKQFDARHAARVNIKFKKVALALQWNTITRCFFSYTGGLSYFFMR